MLTSCYESNTFVFISYTLQIFYLIFTNFLLSTWSLRYFFDNIQSFKMIHWFIIKELIYDFCVYSYSYHFSHQTWFLFIPYYLCLCLLWLLLKNLLIFLRFYIYFFFFLFLNFFNNLFSRQTFFLELPYFPLLFNLFYKSQSKPHSFCLSKLRALIFDRNVFSF